MQSRTFPVAGKRQYAKDKKLDSNWFSTTGYVGQGNKMNVPQDHPDLPCN
jgi:hypothetical protein